MDNGHEVVAPGSCLTCQLFQSVHAKTNHHNDNDGDSRYSLHASHHSQSCLFPHVVGNYHPHVRGGETEAQGVKLHVQDSRQ